jgi:hypothetical protein
MGQEKPIEGWTLEGHLQRLFNSSGFGMTRPVVAREPELALWRRLDVLRILQQKRENLIRKDLILDLVEHAAFCQ